VKRINFLKEQTERLGRLLSARRTGPRKYALFMVACCRRDIAQITDPDCLALIDLAERRADGEVPAAAVAQLRRKVHRWAGQQSFNAMGPSFHKRWVAVWGAWQTAKSNGRPVWGFMNHKPYRPLLADVIGPSPMTATFSPAWRTDTAVALARQMYESREFGAMPILADALQDAGCDDDEILGHCRKAGATHVRGCWVCDLVLGKK
jgi:hypothetical protein